MSTQQQRQEWAALAAAATPGEWYVERVPFKDTDAACIDNNERRIVTLYPPLENRHADAAFIAAARAAVPALLADVDALTAERDEVSSRFAAQNTALAQATQAREQALAHYATVVAERDALAEKLHGEAATMLGDALLDANRIARVDALIGMWQATTDSLNALTAERDALAVELAQVRARLATVDDFGADCYVWGLDNKTWRPDFAEWSQWKREEAQPQA